MTPAPRAAGPSSCMADRALIRSPGLHWLHFRAGAAKPAPQRSPPLQRVARCARGDRGSGARSVRRSVRACVSPSTSPPPTILLLLLLLSRFSSVRDAWRSSTLLDPCDPHQPSRALCRSCPGISLTPPGSLLSNLPRPYQARTIRASTGPHRSSPREIRLSKERCRGPCSGHCDTILSNLPAGGSPIFWPSSF